MARYWLLVSHELMDSDPQWPDGLRPVKQADDSPGPSSDCAWWLFEDDGAAPELDGKRVELEFAASYDQAGNKTAVITDRRVSA